MCAFIKIKDQEIMILKALPVLCNHGELCSWSIDYSIKNRFLKKIKRGVDKKIKIYKV
jgi:hypothetical protein